ncbi:putative gustatory receptor 28b isoform X2 [Prorops nasuta]|uniref:putative gustatory receptor 28b isoform X2 n=1 Tax=Prorops nasuta TaxID=863751 RepID=UPI0034CE1E2B
MTKRQILPKVKHKTNSFWIFKMSIILFKVIGLATPTISSRTYNIHSEHSFKLVYSKLGNVYNLTIVILMISTLNLCITARLNLQYALKSSLTMGIGVGQSILGCLCLSVIFLYYCWEQNSWIKIVNRALEIRYQLHKIDLPIEGHLFLTKTLLLVSFNVIIFLAVCITDYTAYSSNPVAWFTYLIPGFLIGWIYIQYYLIVSYLNTRLMQVNRAFLNMSRMNWTTECDAWSLQQTRRIFISSKSVKRLQQLKHIHEMLCEVCSKISDFYALPIIFGTSFLFFSLIYNAYYFITPFLRGTVKNDCLEIINIGLVLVSILYPLILVTLKNTETTKQFRKTGSITHKLLDSTIGEDIKKELKQFSLQLLHWKIEFTAYELFPFNSSFLHMCFTIRKVEVAGYISLNLA